MQVALRSEAANLGSGTTGHAREHRAARKIWYPENTVLDGVASSVIVDGSRPRLSNERFYGAYDPGGIAVMNHVTHAGENVDRAARKFAVKSHGLALTVDYLIFVTCKNVHTTS